MKMFSIVAILLFCSQAFAIKGAIFRQEIREHRARTADWAVQIYEKYPQAFLGLQNLPDSAGLNLLVIYLSLHDLPKTMTLEQLGYLEIQRSETLFNDLKKGYGACQAPPCVSQLNEVEERLKILVMAKKISHYSAEVQLLIWRDLRGIERLADVIDTKVWRGPELGFRFKPGDSEEFFRTRGLMFEAKIASEFEPQVIAHRRSCRRSVQSFD